MRPLEAIARPRVGLLGNPSDLYGGATLAFAFDAFRTRVRIAPAERLEVCPGHPDSLCVADWPSLLAEHCARDCERGVALVVAAAQRLVLHAPELRELSADDPRARFALVFDSDIPRQSGLSGSSAIVIAALRAMAEWFGVALAPFELSEHALAAETEELGLLAGPQDRVAQSYEGLVAMDFSRPRSAASYRVLDSQLLPPLWLAHDTAEGEPSASVHAEVRRRFDAGDPEVHALMARFPELVREGLAALDAGDADALSDAVDENLEARARLFPIQPRDLQMIELARAHGASAKLAGSGGAVVGVLPDEAVRPALEESLQAAGFRTLVPCVVGPRPVRERA